MTNIEIIKRLKGSTFVDEDRENYTLDFKPGLTNEELNSLRSKFPSNKISDELIEIMKETKGWEDFSLEAVCFDSIDEFGFTELIPHSITLGHDGFGNFWILDMKENGDLGKIYFACHDPAVLVIYSDTLNEFLLSLEEFYTNPEKNYLNKVHDKVVMEIWKKNPNTFDINEFRENNIEFGSFLEEFNDDNWIVADLRNGEKKDGFAWGLFGSNEFTKRHPTELIWVIQKKKKGFFSKIFGN